MAELNLKQIIDRLNAEFTGETRKLVFWYDDKAEFGEDMKTVELQNAKVYLLQKDNQFYTKYFLERQDGFIYKRDKIAESDKIGGVSNKNAWINRRYIVSKEAINDDGVQNIGLGYVLGYEDDKVVTFPIPCCIG